MKSTCSYREKLVKNVKFRENRKSPKKEELPFEKKKGSFHLKSPKERQENSMLKRKSFYEIGPIERLIFALVMLIVLLLLMSFRLMGEVEHEHLGIALMVLMIFHLLFVRRVKGSDTTERFKVIFAIAFALCALTGAAISRYDFGFYEVIPYSEVWEEIHFMSAYWCVILVGIHIGFQEKSIAAILPKTLCRIGRVFVYALSIYGVVVLFTTPVVSYLFFGRGSSPVDYSSGLGVFFFQYLAVVTLMAFLSAKVQQKRSQHAGYERESK